MKIQQGSVKFLRYKHDIMILGEKPGVELIDFFDDKSGKM